jgi:hypothetical protein
MRTAISCTDSSKDDSDVNSCHVNVQHMLNKYPKLFEEPKLTAVKSTFGDITPECIPIVEGAHPVSRPPFRLSRLERTEVEIN